MRIQINLRNAGLYKWKTSSEKPSNVKDDIGTFSNNQISFFDSPVVEPERELLRRWICFFWAHFSLEIQLWTLSQVSHWSKCFRAIHCWNLFLFPLLVPKWNNTRLDNLNYLVWKDLIRALTCSKYHVRRHVD